MRRNGKKNDGRGHGNANNQHASTQTGTTPDTIRSVQPVKKGARNRLNKGMQLSIVVIAVALLLIGLGVWMCIDGNSSERNTYIFYKSCLIKDGNFANSKVYVRVPGDTVVVENDCVIIEDDTLLWDPEIKEYANKDTVVDNNNYYAEEISNNGKGECYIYKNADDSKDAQFSIVGDSLEFHAVEGEMLAVADMQDEANGRIMLTLGDKILHPEFAMKAPLDTIAESSIASMPTAYCFWSDNRTLYVKFDSLSHAVSLYPRYGDKRIKQFKKDDGNEGQYVKIELADTIEGDTAIFRLASTKHVSELIKVRQADNIILERASSSSSGTNGWGITLIALGIFLLLVIAGAWYLLYKDKKNKAESKAKKNGLPNDEVERLKKLIEDLEGEIVQLEIQINEKENSTKSSSKRQDGDSGEDVNKHGEDNHREQDAKPNLPEKRLEWVKVNLLVTKDNGDFKPKEKYEEYVDNKLESICTYLNSKKPREAESLLENDEKFNVIYKLVCPECPSPTDDAKNVDDSQPQGQENKLTDGAEEGLGMSPIGEEENVDDPELTRQEDELRIKQAELEKLEQQLANLQKGASTLLEYGGSSDDYDNDNHGDGKDNAKDKGNVKDLKKQIDQLNNAKKKLENKNKALESANAELQGKIAVEKKRADERIQKEKEKIEKESTEKIKRANERADRAEKEAKETEHKVTEKFNRQIVELNQTIEKQTGKIDGLTNDLRTTKNNLENTINQLDKANEEIDRKDKALERFNTKITDIAIAKDYASKLESLLAIGYKVEAEAATLAMKANVDSFLINKYLVRYRAAISIIDIPMFITEVNNITKVQFVYKSQMLATYDQNDKKTFHESMKMYFYGAYLKKYIDALMVLNETMIGLQYLEHSITSADVKVFEDMRKELLGVIKSLELEVDCVHIWDSCSDNLDLSVESRELDFDCQRNTICQINNCIVYLKGGDKPNEKIKVIVQR